MQANPNLASAAQALGSNDGGPATLLETVIGSPIHDAGANQQAEHAGLGLLDAFLAEERVGEALRLWLGESLHDEQRYPTAESVALRLTSDIAAIDAILSAQVNSILHHPRFQQLEASWRGIAFLVRRSDLEGDSMVKIKILPVSWRELEKDFERAVEFDQSQAFKKIYEQEFGSPGGEPFGLMIGDYSVSHRVSRDQPTDDIAVLRAVAGLAASSFCPFLCAAKPELLDLESFSDLQITRDHAKRLSMADYMKWNALRSDEDARFLGILLPRILMRGPYQDDGSRVDRFIFAEDYRNPDGSGYLWGNPAYAYAAVAIRAFATSGWLADVRGLRQDEDGGGIVSDLPSLSFPTDAPGVIPMPITDVTISDSLERQLSDLGLVPLCDCKDTPLAVFASGQSMQKPKSYNDGAASANARISAMLPYILTVSRFAHYVKVIGRSRTGSFASADEIERHLHDWVMDYVSPDREASTEIKARRPLREASITVRPDPGMPGSFHCVMRLAPHYELDEVVGSVRLTTTIRGS